MNVMMMDYRGYGNSEGTPTEHGLILDAESCLRHLLTRDDINKHAIFLFGRSLGEFVLYVTVVWLSECIPHMIELK